MPLETTEIISYAALFLIAVALYGFSLVIERRQQSSNGDEEQRD